jgi:hypothetical protein
MGYIPLWTDVLDSSIWEEPDIVFRVWITMLLLADYDHVVRKSPYAIAKRAGRGQEEVAAALKVLESPDRRRSDPQVKDGRRIEKLEDGSWLIINGEKYQGLMKESNLRACKRKWAAEHRARVKSGVGMMRLQPDAKVRVYEEKLDAGRPDGPGV